jgi:hypothetical protein
MRPFPEPRSRFDHGGWNDTENGSLRCSHVGCGRFLRGFHGFGDAGERPCDQPGGKGDGSHRAGVVALPLAALAALVIGRGPARQF